MRTTGLMDYTGSLLFWYYDSGISIYRNKANFSTLNELGTPPVLNREVTFVTSCLLSSTPSTLPKRVYSKKKEFAPRGSKSFSFRVDPFSEGKLIQFDSLPPFKMHSFFIMLYQAFLI